MYVNEQDWREAAEAAFAGLSGYIHELNTDVGLYRAVRRTMDDAKVVVRTHACMCTCIRLDRAWH